MREMNSFKLIVSSFLLGILSIPEGILYSEALLVEKVIAASNLLLNRGDISYAWGGSQVLDGTGDGACHLCQKCLSSKAPKPKKQLKTCPECQGCSLDCSHFIQKVFKEAGIDVPYLTTRDMVGMSNSQLGRAGYLRLRSDSEIKPGDIVVYKGHVVLVEKTYGNGRGDVVHATSGKELRGPGQGIQRARFAPFSGFRGPVLSILRHKRLAGASSSVRPRFRRISPSGGEGL